MKVCTDSCIFGAWVAINSSHKLSESSQVLDIGTGTGLLSLMVAQKCLSEIEAVDINEGCVLQASANFSQSTFSKRLRAFETDIVEFNSDKKYDLIISNPPFFKNQLRSPRSQFNLAKHEEGLSLSVLMRVCFSLVKNDGCIALLLPYERYEEALNEFINHGLFVSRYLLISQTEKHSFFRCAFIVSKVECLPLREDMNIKEGGEYSEDFNMLLGDYYLNL